MSLLRLLAVGTTWATSGRWATGNACLWQVLCRHAHVGSFNGFSMVHRATLVRVNLLRNLLQHIVTDVFDLVFNLRLHLVPCRNRVHEQWPVTIVKGSLRSCCLAYGVQDKNGTNWGAIAPMRRIFNQSLLPVE